MQRTDSNEEFFQISISAKKTGMLFGKSLRKILQKMKGASILVNYIQDSLLISVDNSRYLNRIL